MNNNQDKKEKNDKNSNKKHTQKNTLNKKLIAFLVFFIIIFVLLLIRIFWIQFIKGPAYKEVAHKQQTIDKFTSPKRGTIYDCNGKILAISAQVDTITINPTNIKYSDKKSVEPEKIAKALSEIFELDYETVLKKVNSNNSIETIAKKVELDKVEKLKNYLSENEITSGINIDEDSKRYYPFNSLASNLIGFCGDDNEGLEGLEAKWNEVLAGTPGKIITSKNSAGQEIPDSKQTYIATENGCDLVLTIDAKIQSIAEKYLKQAVIDNSCARGGNVIIMNPNNGDILAMATYPDYDLNTPFEPYTEEEKTNFSSLSALDKNTFIQKLWKNRAVTDGYEPGSTFKILTSAIALEEQITDTDVAGDFSCTGSYKVADRNINCWKRASHGSQTLRNALENSCNPAFMQLGQRIGVNRFYKYLDAFGLFSKTGADISGEVSGLFHAENKVGPVELATMSFGQRFTITPLQLITAVSSTVNGGTLVKPKIVKQIVNNDIDYTTTIETTEVRKVISEQTSQKIKSMMKSVVTDGTGSSAKIEGYSIGGKSGTSEPPVGNKEAGYVASFIAITPCENPQIIVLVTLYAPKGNLHQGGQVAGPVAKQILSEVLPYMGILPNS